MAKKNYNYFSAFSKQISFCVSASELLEQSFTEFNPSRVDEIRTKLHGIENAADQKKHELMDALSKEFIAPIEREDIARLANEIDEVVDCIEEVYQRAYMFNLKSVPPSAVRFCRIISMCCAALSGIMDEFPKFRRSEKIGALIIDVNSLEGEGDKLYVESMHKLHAESSNPAELLTWTFCYDSLEKCCDACEHVANVTESVIMKNS